MRRARAAAILALAVGGALFYLVSSRWSPRGERFVDIPKGASTPEIAVRLGAAGVVRQSWLFLAARALRPRAKLQAGEYRFASPASPLEVLDRLARGDVFYYQLSVPEGHSSFDIAASLESLEIMDPREFLRAVRDPSLIRDLAPEGPSLEGYLFPDTYRLTRHTSPEELCRMLTRRFRAAWKELGAPAGAHRTVTLASLIEKEAAVAEERPLIASVYGNRLKIGVKLDCDPTTVYAAQLEGRYRGVIHRSDLDRSHPYNTYRRAGLPPGPIANPGLASLRAALEPAQSDFLYFVARPDGSGRHQFSRNLAAHEAAASRYRRAQNHQKAAPARVSRRQKTGRR
ncbi:MAG: endolytic transglycosylase MltG [Acidobacteria bacterium]|nr:endolytic transglycosylase MltG [Acidobacteriota bacterium]